MRCTRAGEVDAEAFFLPVRDGFVAVQPSETAWDSDLLPDLVPTLVLCSVPVLVPVLVLSLMMPILMLSLVPASVAFDAPSALHALHSTSEHAFHTSSFP